MKKDNLEVTLILLSTSVLLLLIMTTFLVVNIEKKITEKPFIPPKEEEITINTQSLATGFYYNTSDIDNLTNIMFNKDGSFAYNYNSCNGQDHLTGTYIVDDNYIYMTILDNTEIEKEFMMVILSDNMLEYRGSTVGCSPYEYSVYILK